MGISTEILYKTKKFRFSSGTYIEVYFHYGFRGWVASMERADAFPIYSSYSGLRRGRCSTRLQAVRDLRVAVAKQVVKRIQK